MRFLHSTLCVLGGATFAATLACADADTPTTPTRAMAPSGPARTIVNFGFTEIGAPADGVLSRAINDAGQVAIDQEALSSQLGALWVNGSTQLLAGGTPGFLWTSAFDVNALGTVVGAEQTLAGGSAAVWEGGVFTALSPYPGSTSSPTATAINDAGEIVGSDGDGLFWSDKSAAAPVRLQSLGSGSRIFDINNAGIIVGESSASSSNFQAVVWTSETAAPQVLAGLGGTPCTSKFVAARAINEMGEIVGQCPTSDGSTHAVYWANKDAAPIDLDLLAGDSFATGINELGQIVGYARSGSDFRAMLWSREGGVFRRFDLGAPAGLYVTFGTALNNTGQAVLDANDNAQLRESFVVSIPMRAAIDLDPSSTTNAIRLGKGTVTVAVLGSRWFRAADVDPASLTFGNDDGLDTPVSMKKGVPVAKLTDVNRDGFLDLVADFDEGALMSNGDLVVGTQTLVLLGRTKTGAYVRGTDVARASK
jgi:uncharacterized membrane protein